MKAERSPFELDPETWATLNRLLDEALDLPEPEREAWLSALAPEHRVLARRLKSLLARASASPLGTLPKLEDTAPESSGAFPKSSTRPGD